MRRREAEEAVRMALAIHRELLPVYTGTFRNQGVINTKASLAMLGLPGGPVRPPRLAGTGARSRAASRWHRRPV